MNAQRESAIRERDANFGDEIPDHWIGPSDRRVLLGEIDRLRKKLTRGE